MVARAHKGNIKWQHGGKPFWEKSEQFPVIYLQFYTYVSQDSLGLYKVSPTRKPSGAASMWLSCLAALKIWQTTTKSLHSLQNFLL